MWQVHNAFCLLSYFKFQIGIEFQKKTINNVSFEIRRQSQILVGVQQPSYDPKYVCFWLDDDDDAKDSIHLESFGEEHPRTHGQRPQEIIS
jgi:hypothetical protein